STRLRIPSRQSESSSVSTWYRWQPSRPETASRSFTTIRVPSIASSTRPSTVSKRKSVNNNHRGFVLLAALVFASHSFAAAEKSVVSPAPHNPPLKPCTSVTVDTPTQVLLGKSTVIKLSTPAARMVVGGLSSSRAGKPVEVVEDKNAPPGVRPVTAAN